jgi:hypothetical protein
MARADTVVIRVEQEAEVLVKRGEIWFDLLQNKGFEEPGRVREVPFDRAGVRHRLCHAVFGRQRLGQGERVQAYRGKTGSKYHGALPATWLAGRA